MDNAKNSKQGLVTLDELGKGPWQADIEELKPCWSRALLGKFASRFENEKEYHILLMPFYESL